MFLTKFKSVCAASLLPVLLLSACGQVKFSGDTSQNRVNTNSPYDPNNPTPVDNLRDVHQNHTVAPAASKVDVILVIDDSNSMLADNQKLAANLSGFVSKLQNSSIDWQMCATVTRAIPITDTRTAWGASIYWQSSDTPSSALGIVLKKGAGDLPTIFSKTINYINAGWVGSDDERGIKAAYSHVYNGDLRYQPNSGCYRADSAIAYIIISDEDERSIGGDSSQLAYEGELKELEEEDKPQVFVNFVKDTFGASRRFTVNSIIVKPGDSSCKSTQDAAGSKSHYGFKYAELSGLTGGGVGSICDSDYSANLNLFFDRIQDSLSSVPLECQPYQGNISVTITPNTGPVQSKIEGMNLVFDTPIPAGHTIDIRYKCADGGRGPSSAGPASTQGELGFWARITNFFKNLF